MGAIVLTRARIGARSTVAAGSVVLEDFEVPDDMLAAGNPATLKKQLDGRTASAFQNPSAPSEIANGLDIRPSIAVTRARLDVPEIRVAPSAGAPREILYDRMKTAVIGEDRNGLVITAHLYARGADRMRLEHSHC